MTIANTVKKIKKLTGAEVIVNENALHTVMYLGYYIELLGLFKSHKKTNR